MYVCIVFLSQLLDCSRNGSLSFNLFHTKRCSNLELNTQVCMYVCMYVIYLRYVCMYVGLEYLDQRFAWFKYLLSVVDTKLSSVLQPQWCAPAHLFNEFSRFLKHVCVCMYVCMYVHLYIYLSMMYCVCHGVCIHMCIEIAILKSIQHTSMHRSMHIYILNCLQADEKAYHGHPRADGERKSGSKCTCRFHVKGFAEHSRF